MPPDLEQAGRPKAEAVQEVRLLPVAGAPGFLRKHVSADSSEWLLLWRPRLRFKSRRSWNRNLAVSKGAGDDAHEARAVLSTPWQRLLGLDAGWYYALIPQEISVTRMQFCSCSGDRRKYLLVPLHLTLYLDTAEDVRLFFHRFLLSRGSITYQELGKSAMPSEEVLGHFGEPWSARDLREEQHATAAFEKELNDQLRSRTRGTGLSAVAKVGTISVFEDLSELQERRLRLGQLIDERLLKIPEGEINPDDVGLSLAPEDRRLLKTLLYPEASVGGRDRDGIVEGYLRGVEQYAGWLPGRQVGTPVRPGGWLRRAWPYLRPFMPLAEACLSGLVAFLKVPLPENFAAATKIALGTASFMAQEYAVLRAESWYGRRVSRRTPPVADRVAPLVLALIDEGQRRRDDDGDLRGAWAHLLAAQDLAGRYGIAEAREDARGRLASVEDELHVREPPIGSPLLPETSDNKVMFVSCAGLHADKLQREDTSLPLGKSLSLYAAPGTRDVDLIVTMRDSKWPNDPVSRVAFRGRVEEQPFSLEWYWQTTGETGARLRQARLRLTGVQVHRQLKEDELNAPLPDLTPVPEPLDLAVVLDGTLPQEQFAQARQLAGAVLRGLDADKVPGWACLVVYGDGPHGDPGHAPACKVWPPSKRAVIERKLEDAQPQAIDDYQSNLEVGLFQALRLLRGSRANHRVVLVVGNSEPHPAYLERKRALDGCDFQKYMEYLNQGHFYDFPSGLDWRQAIADLAQLGVRRLCVLAPSPAHDRRAIWREMASEGALYESLGDDTSQAILTSLRGSVQGDGRVLQLSAPLWLPATSRPEGVVPQEQEWE